MRLLPGLLAGQDGRFELTGDDSLRSRPMERVAQPLRQMGVQVETTDGHAPIVVEGGPVKRDLLRAAGCERPGEVGGPACRPLRGEGRPTVVEPLPTRDHTENMLAAAGADVRRKPRAITVSPAQQLRAERDRGAGRLLLGGPVPRRRDAARGLGADGARPQPQPAADGAARRARADGRAHHRLQPEANRRRGRGDLDVRHAELVGTTIGAAEVPLLVDELPLFALLAVHARGDSVLVAGRGAGRRRDRPAGPNHRAAPMSGGQARIQRLVVRAAAASLALLAVGGATMSTPATAEGDGPSISHHVVTSFDGTPLSSP